MELVRSIRNLHLTLFVVVSFFVCQCNEITTGQTVVSFYYWRTVFSLGKEEKKVLEENNVSKLYVRYFDVVLKDDSPVPAASIIFKQPPENLEVVPVIFIKNDVMLKHGHSVRELADKVIAYINEINSTYAIHNSEIQIDCDWTEKTKDAYFRFVNDVKVLSKKKVSTTIRLHQIKYADRTGIPDADRAVLMYYNMGRISPDSLNSIYDRGIAGRYIEALKNYPLRLTIALPIFSWGVHVRNDRVVGLLGKVGHENFTSDSDFDHRPESPYYIAKKNVTRGGRYFQKGDKIKIEFISKKDLLEMANDLSGQVKQRPKEIIFYDLDEFNLKHFDDENLYQEISRTF